MYNLNQDFISMAVGAIVAFLLWWAPGLGKLWAQVKIKRITLCILFLGVPVAVTLIGCYLPVVTKVTVVCVVDPDPTMALLQNIGQALWLGLMALVGSQGGYVALLAWGKDIIHSAQYDKLMEIIAKVITPKNDESVG